MPYLARLHAAGFSVWPFHERGSHLAVEIYPRLLTGPVTKSSHADRERYLSGGSWRLSSEQVALAASSEDAFDAAVSALIMSLHQAELARLDRATDRTELLEGLIWSPADRSSHLSV